MLTFHPTAWHQSGATHDTPVSQLAFGPELGATVHPEPFPDSAYTLDASPCVSSLSKPTAAHHPDEVHDTAASVRPPRVRPASSFHGPAAGADAAATSTDPATIAAAHRHPTRPARLHATGHPPSRESRETLDRKANRARASALQP